MTVSFANDRFRGNAVAVDIINALSLLFESIDNCTITESTVAGIRLRSDSQAGMANNMISGNGIGILVLDTSIANVLGNTISANGVGLATEGAAFATIGANSFFGNTIGIDLGNDGVTPNDPGDLDGRQNFPELTSALATGTETTINGTLNSRPNQTFTLNFFANRVPAPSGFGEGETFLGSQQVTTDANGNVSFAASVAIVPAGAPFISALATNAAGGTSEFSRDIQVNAPVDCVVCHKGTTTLTLPCNSFEHRRHLDHGDAAGACLDEFIGLGP